MISVYFKESDWQGAVPPCQSSDMQPGLIDKLDYARALCGFPFKINSAYRSEAYERSKGRTGTSSHCTGWAVDIAVKNDKERHIMLQNLLRAGFVRIGIAKTFLHVDCDPSKTAAVWLYSSD